MNSLYFKSIISLHISWAIFKTEYYEVIKATQQATGYYLHSKEKIVLKYLNVGIITKYVYLIVNTNISVMHDPWFKCRNQIQLLVQSI
jgi:hypothetical protein